MNNFIKFKQDSGELTIMKRSAITAFHPKYTHGRGYIVYCSDGAVELAMFKTDTLENAEAWCDEQMEIIDGQTMEGGEVSDGYLEKLVKGQKSV